MKREDLREIICSVIEKLKQDIPEAACGIFWNDNLVATPEYSVGEEITVHPANRYSINEEDSARTLTTHYAVGEED